MANTKISALNSLTKATLATNDVFPVVDTGSTETKKITYQELIQPTDANFRIAGSADNTKLVAFEVDGLTTATTRTITIPDANTTLVGTDATQTLTNKTLTAPQINMGSDATGDTYYRTAGGAFARLPIGTSGQILQSSSSGIPEWTANPSVSDASTTVKGSVELATLAETLARTTTGGTSAKLVVTPDNLTTVKTYDYAADSVGTDAYAITVTPAPTAYVTGQKFTFKAGTANTGAATLNVNSLGAVTIVKGLSSALVTGDILANQVIEVVYDGTNFQMQSPTASSNTFLGIFKNGETTYDASTASGTVNVAHGLGSIPKQVRIIAIDGVATSSNLIAYTVYNGTTQSSTSTWTSGGSTTSSNSFSLNSGVTNTDYSRAVITFDATNIIFTWTKTGSPTGTYDIVWEAIA